MKVIAIVPQKALAASKHRLVSAMDGAARRELALRMLRRVCGALRALSDVEAVVVMTPDPDVAARAASWGVASVPDPAPDLNASLDRTMATTAGHARGVLVLAADLPLLQPADVLVLLHHGAPGSLVIGPSKDGTGTNALLVPPGVRFSPAYGSGSRAVHRRAASAQGLAVIEVVRPGLAFDLDTPADITALPDLEVLLGREDQNQG